MTLEEQKDWSKLLSQVISNNYILFLTILIFKYIESHTINYSVSNKVKVKDEGLRTGSYSFSSGGLYTGEWLNGKVDNY